jgi:hypothetical protein
MPKAATSHEAAQPMAGQEPQDDVVQVTGTGGRKQSPVWEHGREEIERGGRPHFRCAHCQ